MTNSQSDSQLNPQLRISELAQDKAIILLSKASGISEEIIVKLDHEKLEITEEIAGQLRAIAEALEICVSELFHPISSQSSIQDLTIEDWAKEQLLDLNQVRRLTNVEDGVGEKFCKLFPNAPGCRQQ